MATQQPDYRGQSRGNRGEEEQNGPEPPNDYPAPEIRCGPIAMVTLSSRRESWRDLQPGDRYKESTDLAIRALLRDLVDAAVHGDEAAIRIFSGMFRTAIYAKVRGIASATDSWWRRDELANDLITFLVMGVRPSLRHHDGKPQRSNQVTVPPLAQWFEGGQQSLQAFVSTALANVRNDMFRRSRVQRRLGATDKPLAVDARSDVDTDFVPNNLLASSRDYQPERRMIADDEEKLYALAARSLNANEFRVLSALRCGTDQKGIALEMGLSPGRVSQIKNEAIQKMRDALVALGIALEGSKT